MPLPIPTLIARTVIARTVALSLILALSLGLAATARAQAPLAAYFGSYVGVATVETLTEGTVSERHMDIVIEPYQSGGFRITWINVTLVDGRRDVPGVERRVNEVAFTPESDTPPRGRGRYVAAPDYSPFRAQEEFSPMAGDPVIWAQLDGTGLHVYSFVILDNGRYEIQIYTRSLTEDGLTLHFERIVDGEVIRRIEGHAVRAR